MCLTNRLGPFIDEYLREGRNGVQRIAIRIPEHKGQFFIFETFRLTLQEQENFGLSIQFSFVEKTRKGLRIAARINESGCFHGFTMSKSGRGVAYSKDFGNNKLGIIASVEFIAKSLFPGIQVESISAEILRISGWIIIQEDKGI